MKKTKLLSSLMGLVLVLCTLLTFAVAPASAEGEPALSLYGATLSLKDNIYINYYVDVENADPANVKVLFWTAVPESGEYTVENADSVAENYYKINNGYYVYQYTALTAKQIADSIYARAYVDNNGTPVYSEVKQYSIMQYCYNQLVNEGATDDLKTLCNNLLEYGSSAQLYSEYNTENLANSFCQIKVGGTEDKGTLYRKGDTVTLTTSGISAIGTRFVGWQNSKSETVSTDAVYTFTADTSDVLTAVYGDVATYLPVEFQADEDSRLNRAISAYIWSGGKLDMATNVGSGFPFRGTVTFSAITDGKVTISVDNNGSVTVYEAFVDPVHGYLVFPRSSTLMYAMLAVPLADGEGNPALSDFSASAWQNAIAITFGTENILIYNENVYFDVRFTDLEGNALIGADCATAPYVAVYSGTARIASFVSDGEKLVIADGLEGTYTDGANTLTLNGNGAAVYNGEAGTYTVESADTVGVYVGDTYYSVVLNTATKTFVANAPTYTVTYVTAVGELAPSTVSKNVAFTLPVPTATETQVFRGWYYDEAFTQPVGTSITLTEGDVELYAKWVARVNITVRVDVDDVRELVLGEGDVIGDVLDALEIGTDETGLDLANKRLFDDWYLVVEDGEDILVPSEAELTADEDPESAIIIYAKWIALPAYYGTYYGSELYNAGYGNNGGKQLTIDKDGSITGFITGTVVSYDPETQIITATVSSKTAYLFFDPVAKVIAYNESSYTYMYFGNDYYFFAQDIPSTGKVYANYGVYAPKGPSNAGTMESSFYYAQFVQLTADSAPIFLWYDTIYSDVTFETSTGEALLTVEDIKAASSVVIRDAEGNLILALATQTGGAISSNSSKMKLLDAYFGTYTNGSERLLLDGSGTVIYGEKTGTYTETAANTFDVFFADNTEYCVLTLDGSAFSIVKPTVTVTYVSELVPVDADTVNIRVPFALPTLTHSNYVFRGWYLDPEFNTEAPAVFNEDTVVYAKWLEKAYVIVIYNNGDLPAVFEYGIGEIPTDVVRPEYEKHKFVGWYTTPAFVEDSEWSAEAALTGTVVVYAKWEDAPIFNQTYYYVGILGTDANGGVSTYDDRYYLTFDPYGFATGVSYPYGSSTVTITYVNETTGEITFTVVDKSGITTVYKGYVDPVSGLMFVEYKAGNELAQGWFFTPFETASDAESHFSSSYWNAGKTRAIAYTYDGVTYTAFVWNNTVYFGVSFRDAFGNNIAGADCFGAQSLYIYAADGSLLVALGYNGTTMVELDGYQGTYTGELGNVILDGNKGATVNGVAGSYAAAPEDAGYTFDLWFGTSYYELTVDQSAGTYTVNHPVIHVTFDTDGKATVEAIDVDKNVAITLPVPANDGYVFRGWYLAGAEDVLFNDSYVFTENVTLYAKWDAKVTLTVVYGNGIDTVTADYGSGDALDMSIYKPSYTNGKMFTGWFSDEACTEAFAATTISANTSVYAGWVEGDLYTFSNGTNGSATSTPWTYSEENDSYTSPNAGINNSDAYMRIDFNGEATITFTYNVSSEANYDILYVIYNALSQSGSVLAQNEDGTYSGTGTIIKLSGTGNTPQKITINVKAGDYLVFKYHKDSSGYSGTDQAVISEITVS